MILSSLKAGMTVAVILRCPDGHLRRVIYDLAAYIADYPEQVYLAGIVQGWCPRYVSLFYYMDSTYSGTVVCLDVLVFQMT